MCTYVLFFIFAVGYHLNVIAAIVLVISDYTQLIQKMLLETIVAAQDSVPVFAGWCRSSIAL